MNILKPLLDRDQEESEKKPQQQDGGFFFCLNISKYFDVQTEDVYNRLKSALFLTPPFQSVIGTNPDLYGPFWIATTLIGIIIATSSLVDYLYGTVATTYNFEFIPVSSSLIFGITFGTPYLLAIVIKFCFGGKMPVVKFICTYGYSMTAFIPVTFLCFINSTLVQTIVLSIGFAISVIFLMRNILSIQSDLDEKQKYMIISILIGMQLVLVLTYKFYFFKVK